MRIVLSRLKLSWMRQRPHRGFVGFLFFLINNFYLIDGRQRLRNTFKKEMPWSSIDENKHLFIKMTDFHTDSAVSRVRGRFLLFSFFVEDAFWNFPDIM